jgi:uncharacterized protein
MTLSWAWRVSRQVDPRFKMRLKFVAAALRNPGAGKELALADPSSPLGELLAEWPQTVGLLLWPYQCASWDALTRVDRVAEHFATVRQIPGLKLRPDEKLVLADLSSFNPDAFLILDRPPWLSREGHLTLSLFKGDFRAFTLSFSLSGFPETELFIGGLQGRHGEEILSMYRDLTKDLNGIRPRDFMLETLRMFALKIGVHHIYAIADEFKISRHRYFGKKGPSGLYYDEVWQERNAERKSMNCFELPLAGSRRSLEEIAAKKRSMYRRRYDMLDQIEAMLPSDLTNAERRQFQAR